MEQRGRNTLHRPHSAPHKGLTPLSFGATSAKGSKQRLLPTAVRIPGLVRAGTDPRPSLPSAHHSPFTFLRGTGVGAASEKLCPFLLFSYQVSLSSLFSICSPVVLTKATAPPGPVSAPLWALRKSSLASLGPILPWTLKPCPPPGTDTPLPRPEQRHLCSNGHQELGPLALLCPLPSTSPVSAPFLPFQVSLGVTLLFLPTRATSELA